MLVAYLFEFFCIFRGLIALSLSLFLAISSSVESKSNEMVIKLRPEPQSVL